MREQLLMALQPAFIVIIAITVAICVAFIETWLNK